MRTPSYATLCSFVFSLLLTSAMIPSAGNVSLAAAGAPAAQAAATAVLNGLRAQGLAGSAELALPAPAATPTAAAAPAAAKPAPIITPEQMAKLLALLASDKGGDHELPWQLANPLGLGAPGQPFSARTLGAGDMAGLARGFAISKGSEQDIVVSNITAGKNAYLYRAHRDGTLVAAIIADLSVPGSLSVVTWSVQDAQKSYLAEVGLWTGMVSNPVTASK